MKRKKTKKGREDSGERLKVLLENTPFVVYLKDLDGRYLMVNRQFETRTGMAREKIIGKTDYDLFGKETADALRANDETVRQEGKTEPFLETATSDQGTRSYISFKFPLVDDVGAVTAICGVSNDVTEGDRGTEEQKRFIKDLEEAFAAVRACKD